MDVKSPRSRRPVFPGSPGNVENGAPRHLAGLGATQRPNLGLPALGGAETKMKRPVRLLGRAAPNPKYLQNPFGSLGNPELKSKTSTGEPTNTLNSTMTLANNFRRQNPNSIHTPVEHGDNRRGGRTNGRRLKTKRRFAVLVACIS